MAAELTDRASRPCGGIGCATWKARFMEKHYLKLALGLCSVVALLAPAHGYVNISPAGPFLGLSGQWSGAGTVTMADGSTERVRCNSANAVNANGKLIKQNLRCTSGRFRLDITSDVAAKGGSLSGSWAEKARCMWGNGSGRACGSAIRASL